MTALTVLGTALTIFGAVHTVLTMYRTTGAHHSR